MMSESRLPDDQEWEGIVERHLRHELGEDEQRLLAERLDRDDAFRKQFVEWVTWDTELTETIRLGGGKRVPSFSEEPVWEEAPSRRQGANVLRTLLALAGLTIFVLSVLLVREKLQSEAVAATVSPVPEIAPVAQISGLSGSLIWTGDRGEIVRDIRIGTKLTGGTIEGLSPDSWFELKFTDGTAVMISGTSMLTFSDFGQKVLRLRQGIFSADVVPQPEGKPMLVHTPSAVLEVVGTQFDVEAHLASTMLNVNEGKVRIRRLSDGREVDVPAKHRILAEGEGELSPQRLPNSVSQWTSQLSRQRGGYGKWIPESGKRPAAQKAIPLIPSNNSGVTLYLAGIPVSRRDSPPVVVREDSRFIVRGRLKRPARVYFGIAVSTDNGEFAGKFRGDLSKEQPISMPDGEGNFEVVYQVSDFSIDPCEHERQQELLSSPVDGLLNGVWAFTSTEIPSGLEITSVNLVTPNE